MITHFVVDVETRKRYYVFDDPRTIHIGIAADGSILGLRTFTPLKPIHVRSVNKLLPEMILLVKEFEG